LQLSTYLGHAHVTDTYWYVSEVHTEQGPREIACNAFLVGILDRRTHGTGNRKGDPNEGQGRLPKNRTCFWGVAIAGCHCLNGTVNGTKDIHEKCYVLKVKSSEQALPEAAP